MHGEYFEFEFEVEDDKAHYLFYVEGHGEWDIDNDSFDYAGTHCTHGQSGTCHLPDYARIEDIDLSIVRMEIDTGKKEVVKKELTWKKDSDKVLEFEKEWRDRIMEELQEQEDDNGSVMQGIKDYAEEVRLGI